MLFLLNGGCQWEHPAPPTWLFGALREPSNWNCKICSYASVEQRNTWNFIGTRPRRRRDGPKQKVRQYVYICHIDLPKLTTNYRLMEYLVRSRHNVSLCPTPINTLVLKQVLREGTYLGYDEEHLFLLVRTMWHIINPVLGLMGGRDKT